MARKGRVEYAGAIYHVMSRGNGGEAVFWDEEDRHRFLSLLGEVCVRQGWIVHAYVLLDNHYHLLLETPEPNLVSGMKWFLGTYTQRFNARHKRRGHLFQGRYKAIVVEREDGGYFTTAADYIHLNPVRAGLISPKEGLEAYVWSSYPAYAYKRVQAPDWLHQTAVLGALDYDLSGRGRRLFRQYMALRVAKERGCTPQQRDELYKAMRRGWYIGGKDFRDYLTERFDVDHGNRPYEADGEVKKDHQEFRARQILEAGLRHFRLVESDLPDMKKNSMEKRVIGYLIKQSTSVSLAWLSENLYMGVVSGVSRYCGRLDDLIETDSRVVTHRNRIVKIARIKD
jgi:REP element-mobilizing transposase RayT